MSYLLKWMSPTSSAADVQSESCLAKGLHTMSRNMMESNINLAEGLEQSLEPNVSSAELVSSSNAIHVNSSMRQCMMADVFAPTASQEGVIQSLMQRCQHKLLSCKRVSLRVTLCTPTDFYALPSLSDSDCEQQEPATFTQDNNDDPSPSNIVPYTWS